MSRSRLHGVVTKRCGWVAMLVLAGLGACERDQETTRALLRDQQQQWARDLGTLRQQEGELRSRLVRLSAVRPSAPNVAQAAGVQVEPLLNGTRQAIGDVETQAQQAAQRLEPALRRGGQPALDAFEGERAQISGYVQMMREQLNTAARELASLEHG
jgi:hypothetical protein